jgi:Flp pilus assembly protein TadB
VEVPITIRCDCGVQTAATAGEVITCACGRAYATELSSQQKAGLVGLRQKMRAFARLGVGVVGLLSLVALAFLGPLLCFVVLVGGIGLWWGVLQQSWKRRCAARIAALPPGTVSPLRR